MSYLSHHYDKMPNKSICAGGRVHFGSQSEGAVPSWPGNPDAGTWVAGPIVPGLTIDNSYNTEAS